MTLQLRRHVDGSWTVGRGDTRIALTDGEMRRLARLVEREPGVADDDELEVCGRLICQVCGEVGNVDPEGHREQFVHQPIVLTGGLRYVHRGHGSWQLADEETWAISAGGSV